uniref:Reverse transcriptase domain-containing protein n=1 Tax=Tanacetum cinerariifolium TaxID=118510 RepID=A0A699H5W1_TANCI|nr:reverse transcriptase domain-containing protein [Tanacetum cinerariifolium]
MSSDEASLRVTYTSISSDYEESSDVCSPGVIVYEYDGLLMHLVDPPSLDYVHGPKEPENSDDGPTDYPADSRDNDEDDSSRDDVDDEDKEEASEEDEDEDEEEHLAPTGSIANSLAIDPVPSVEETEPFETDEFAVTPAPPAYRTNVRIAKIPEADIPPRKRLCLTAPTSRFEVGESLLATAARQPGLEAAHTTNYGFVDMVDDNPKHHVPREVRYGIHNTWDELVDVIQEGASTTLEGVNARVTELVETLERDTWDLYAHLDDVQDSQARLSDRVNILLKDRQIHQKTVILIEDEALKMPPRKGTRTRTTPATATITATILMTDAAIRVLIAQGAADALAEQTIQRNTNLNGDKSQGSGSGITRPVRPTRECTYTDCLKCQPLNFKGTEGVNTHVKIVGHDAAYNMPWKILMKMMTAKYYPQNEIKKLEIEIWNLKGHFKRECPKLKNKNHGNQGGNGNALAKVYVVGNVGTNSDLNVVIGTFLLKNRYAFILFDTSADRSFISTAFSSLFNITPTTLDHYYDVELADEKIIRINTIIRGCTLKFLNHPFNIDLMPMELGSFNIIDDIK